MKVWIKVLGLPELVSVFGEKRFSFSFCGQTLQELLQGLSNRYGPPLAPILFAPEGGLNEAIQILVKGNLCAQRMDRPIYLQEDAEVTFVVFVEGG